MQNGKGFLAVEAQQVGASVRASGNGGLAEMESEPGGFQGAYQPTGRCIACRFAQVMMEVELALQAGVLPGAEQPGTDVPKIGKVLLMQDRIAGVAERIENLLPLGRRQASHFHDGCQAMVW